MHAEQYGLHAVHIRQMTCQQHEAFEKFYVSSFVVARVAAHLQAFSW
jgi:hypothetical protein